MTTQFWLIVGFIGQGLFSARFVIQWLATEKNRKSVVPLAFWYFSIAGSLTLLAYALFRKDPVFVLGQTFGVFIYLRNLYFIKPEVVKKLIAAISLVVVAILSYLFTSGYVSPEQIKELRSNNTTKDTIWQVIGFVGQIMFSMRFILQWLASEKQKQSVMPVSFWYFSMIGSVTLLSYAIYQKDPVFILGQSFGMIVYLRNLFFIFKSK
ncbi:MAG TPA: lipid-A-disaccharide synthase N-terminal domain-containing protein [Gammaproteobacteria bacterium]|nr:lipid-A-disaccharide synthase N-terminal domain-containing protein [Xanthomonadales bacterium]MCB1593598.1 lipid-A-disaccharide synthase N-terminal domain-containing protein [Xanthomonadales bacterium]HOP21816.1 lipid-A-disaccharide synthase N-terminal domain-containing protein [Gammaproteobacteria bacterium]HPI94957.1 lipid-A-disaccharide synthase N-terminal domain-containing protein [Gammaproteobacteria bacterium]HPQ86223.1 lipid-A-disaccharide synthase N-terminal domain-containing protein